MAYLVWVFSWLGLFSFRPLSLLWINNAFRPLDVDLKIGGVTLPSRWLLFIRWLNYHPRVLDAWVNAHIDIARERFLEKSTVEGRQIHISMPVSFDDNTLPNLNAKDVRVLFKRQIAHLLIWGEGGSGKTSLACQIGRWAMAADREQRIGAHRLLPVLIEDDLDLNVAAGDDVLLSAVGRQVQLLTDQHEPIDHELLEKLLRHQRLLVIVDHLSEMSDTTRASIRPGAAKFPVNALVVTSRLEEALGGSKSVIRPLRISGNRLSSFMEAYLTQRRNRELFDDSEFFEACRRLSQMVGDRDITPLLARLYIEQVVAHKERMVHTPLPDNIPELMLSYLNELNRSVTDHRLEDRLIHRDAMRLAWACLRRTLRPTYATREDALEALGGEDREERLQYMEDRLHLIQTIQPAQDRVRFLFDPLAEYLAGLHLVKLYASDEAAWRKYLTEEIGAKVGETEAGKGFLLALRESCMAKEAESEIPQFVVDELTQRAA